jgi:outer membrane protein assembly factor BamB
MNSVSLARPAAPEPFRGHSCYANEKHLARQVEHTEVTPIQRNIMRLCYFAIALIVMLAWGAETKCEDWPMWRGPRGDGIGKGPDIPTTWSTTENICWKSSIPGDGRSSPIVCRDSVFVATWLPDTLSRRLIRLDRNSGAIVWDVDVHSGPIEKQHKFNTSASSTPATDGNRIYCVFVDDEKMVVSAIDWDGKTVWSVSPGSFYASHGFAASPVLCDGGVLVNGHQDGGAFVVLLDGAAGKEKWRYKPDADLRSFSTPVIATVHGGRQIILSGAKQTVGLDPETGEKIWWVDGPAEKFVCTPSIGLGHVFSFGGSPSERAFAIRQGGTGDLTKTNIAWTNVRSMPYVPTPLLLDQYLHIVNDAGIYTCLEPVSGKVLKTLRIGGNTYSSPVGIADKVYIFDDTGLCTVIRNSGDFELLSKNALEELVQASPAISNGAIFVRGERHIWKIGSEFNKNQTVPE